jgi:predicted ATPase
MGMEEPYFLALLAEAYASVGQIADGLAALAKALAPIPSGRGFFYEAEIYRLQGEFLLLQADTRHTWEEVEACFTQALAIARRQEARALELRAATSLSRLWQQQGKNATAHQLLADVYGWFTEGFDTVDLQEAQAMLAELAGTARTHSH